ncbi:MgtC/SapB family protein [bacterium AH-315-C07]|nr:MgtC/SapB family protein [bacterium AH-315-C07]
MESFIESYTIPLLKLVLAIVFGTAIGAEREWQGKMAGVRTHALVCMGAALYVIISMIVTKKFVGDTMFDPLRVASHIIVGIGFIGGGAIFMKDKAVRGLTTAAGMWVAAGVGMATGFGLYVLAAMVTFLVLFVFTFMHYVEKKFRKNQD